MQLKQKDLELQIANLKIKQHEEKLQQEQSQMKLYSEQVSQLLATEKNLRLQLTADGEKFQQFQVLFTRVTLQISSTNFIAILLLSHLKKHLIELFAWIEVLTSCKL